MTCTTVFCHTFFLNKPISPNMDHCVLALYGMLDSAILYYRKFHRNLKENGYEINPYDPCVVNKQINGKQHTVCWHVDDLKASHVETQVNDEFLDWLIVKYISLAKVTATRGREHG